MSEAIMPFGRPVYVMLKPVGARCNLRCDYCYYLGRGLHEGAVMSEALLEEFIRQYLEAQTVPQVLFTWHGGEPLLRGIDFYRKALELQRKYGKGRQIDNCLQTNGTLLNDEWCRFFHDNHFLIGISIDGTQAMHDGHRGDSSRNGEGTGFRGRSWYEVMRGIGLLKRYGVEWNAMATVNAANVGSPVGFYRFFRQIGCEFLQFTPVVEVSRRCDVSWRNEDSPKCEMSDESITAEEWGRFLCAVYDEWVREDVGRVFVQLFDATLANWCGVAPGVCSMAPTCGQAAVMEADGSVYSCDHFVSPAYRLGNIRQQEAGGRQSTLVSGQQPTLSSLLYSERQQQFGQSKFTSLPQQCRECRWLFACNGECPKNRIAVDCYGNPGLNWLCGGYRQFFSHVAADMDFMKSEIDAGRAPANIMRANLKK